jgi:hypothetical protein
MSGRRMPDWLALLLVVFALVIVPAICETALRG